MISSLFGLEQPQRGMLIRFSASWLRTSCFWLRGSLPRGRATFEHGLRTLLTQHRIESTGDIQELEVAGNLAYCWITLTVRIVPLADGDPVLCTGSTLSIYRKQPTGSWVLVRDANLLPQSQ